MREHTLGYVVIAALVVAIIALALWGPTWP